MEQMDATSADRCETTAVSVLEERGRILAQTSASRVESVPENYKGIIAEDDIPVLDDSNMSADEESCYPSNFDENNLQFLTDVKDWSKQWRSHLTIDMLNGLLHILRTHCETPFPKNARSMWDTPCSYSVKRQRLATSNKAILTTQSDDERKLRMIQKETAGNILNQ